MPRIKQEQKIAVLKSKLEKAKKLKEQYAKQESTLSVEIQALENKERLKVMDILINNPEKLRSLFELNIITEEQFNALNKG